MGAGSEGLGCDDLEMLYRDKELDADSRVLL